MKLFLFAFLLIGGWASCRFDSDHSDRDIPSERREVADKTEEETNDNEAKDDDDDDHDVKSILSKSFFKGSKHLVPIEDLKNIFPKSLQGFDRKNQNGDQVHLFGFNLSSVKSEYEDGDQKIQAEIVDFGGFTEVLSSLADWTDSDLWHQDDDGYSKVDQWHGYKSFERDDVKRKESSLAFIYKDRLIVNLKGDHMSLNDIKDFTEKNILKKLDVVKLKKEENQ